MTDPDKTSASDKPKIANPELSDLEVTIAKDAAKNKAPRFQMVRAFAKGATPHTKSSVKKIYQGLAILATLSGAITFVLFFIPNTFGPGSSKERTISFETRTQLQELIAEGKLTQEQLKELGITVLGDAFGGDGDTGLAGQTAQLDFSKAFERFAKSEDADDREALALITEVDTRSQGFALLESNAKSYDDWQSLADLAYPWDAETAIKAFRKVIKMDDNEVFNHIYLSKLYWKTGNLNSAKVAINNAKSVMERNEYMDAVAMITEKISGDIAYEQNDIEDAIGHFNEALKIALSAEPVEGYPYVYTTFQGTVYDQLTDIYLAKNDLTKAREIIETSLVLRKKQVSLDSENHSHLRELSISYLKLGNIAKLEQNVTLAKTYYEQALDIRQKLIERGDISAKERKNYTRDLIVTELTLSQFYLNSKPLDKARQYAESALQHAEILTENDPTRADYQRDLASVYTRLGEIALNDNDNPTAQIYFTKAYEITRDLAEKDSTSTVYQRDLMVGATKLGDLAYFNQEFEVSVTYYRIGIKGARDIASQSTDMGLHQRDLGVALSKLAAAYEAQGKWSEVLDFGQQALTIREKLVALGPQNVEYQRDLSNSLRAMGRAWKAKDDPARAEDYLNRSLDITRTLKSRDGINPLYDIDLVSSLIPFASLTYTAGDLLKTKQLLKEAKKPAQTLAATDAYNGYYRERNGAIHYLLGQIAQREKDPKLARKNLETSNKIYRKLVTDYPKVVNYEKTLIMSHTALADLKEKDKDYHSAKAYGVLMTMKEDGRLPPSLEGLLASLAKKVELNP